MAVGQARILVSQFVEVGVEEGFEGSGPLRWIVAEEACNEVDCLTGRAMSEDLLPGQGLDLGEAVLCIFGIHGQNLISCWCSEDFDDFNELIDAALPWEDRLA